MEAEGFAGSQSQGDGSDRPVRSDEANQLGDQPLVLQTRIWLFPTLGGNWVLDGYFGAWFFTTNTDFWSRNMYFAGTRSQSQSPIGALEGHLSYDFKPRLWASLDGNFWFGGKTAVNGVQNPLSQEANSRIGGTVAIPITKHQSLKFSYSTGTYIRFGGNYQNVSAAWQYSWLGKPN
jgi:hypothetical protein